MVCGRVGTRGGAMPLGDMEVAIRLAPPSEASVVSEILTEAAAWIRDAGQPLWRIDQLTADLVAPGCAAGCFYLAWSEGVGVGTMRLTDSDPDFWPEALPLEAVYLHRLAVRRAVSGGSVSGALLHHALRIASERRARYLRLDALSDRPRLRAVYERFGFQLHSYRTVRGGHVARYQLEVSAV